MWTALYAGDEHDELARLGEALTRTSPNWCGDGATTISSRRAARWADGRRQLRRGGLAGEAGAEETYSELWTAVPCLSGLNCGPNWVSGPPSWTPPTNWPGTPRAVRPGRRGVPRRELARRAPGVGPGRVELDVVRRQWGEMRIRWEESGWWTAPERIGDRIAPLVGGPGKIVVGDSTSVNVFKALVGAVRLAALTSDGRDEIIVDATTFPTDGYIAASAARLTHSDSAWIQRKSPPRWALAQRRSS